MKLVFSEQAWEDYRYWQEQDRKLLVRINELIKECTRTPFKGTGKPEPLRGSLAGWWSRRINREHRLVYRVEGDSLWIAQCRYHY
jgi:toxin YoeB